jgi:hypothetical protein
MSNSILQDERHCEPRIAAFQGIMIGVNAEESKLFG